MLPVLDLRIALGTLLAADVATLAPVAANKIALISASFVPSENLLIGGVTLASFTGSAPKAGVAGTQGVGFDPVTREQIITILAPVGGWRFVCTAAPVSPETIWGYGLTDNAGAVLIGTALLPTPLTITNVGDEVLLGDIVIRIVSQPMS